MASLQDARGLGDPLSETVKADYAMTAEQAANLATEFIRQSPRVRRWHRLRWLIAVGGGVAFAVLRPPHLEVNGVSSIPVTVAVAVLVQIPLVTLLIFFVLKMASDLPIRATVRAVRSRPKESWGQRTLEIVDGQVIVRSESATHSIKAALVENVLETKSGYHLVHGQQVLLSVPKTVGSLEELRNALQQCAAGSALP